MREKTLIDTGPIVSLFLANDAWHESCVRQIASLPKPLYTSLAVITEACWLLSKSPMGIPSLSRFCEGGMIHILPLTHEEMPSVLEYMQAYRSIRAEFTDATLLYLAERESIGTVFTLDRRDFGVYKLRNSAALSVIPSIF